MICSGCGATDRELRDDGQGRGFLVCGPCWEICERMESMPIEDWPEIRLGESAEEWAQRCQEELLA